MEQDNIRIHLPYDVLLHAIGALLFVSGAVAAVVDVADAAGWNIGSLLAVKSTALKVHGAAGMCFLAAFGALFPTHIRRAWAARRNRVGGGVFIAALLGLIFTGYGLYYVGGEVSRAVVQWVHIALGLAEPPLLVLHIYLGRRTREKMVRTGSRRRLEPLYRWVQYR